MNLGIFALCAIQFHERVAFCFTSIGCLSSYHSGAVLVKITRTKLKLVKWEASGYGLKFRWSDWSNYTQESIELGC